MQIYENNIKVLWINKYLWKLFIYFKKNLPKFVGFLLKDNFTFTGYSRFCLSSNSQLQRYCSNDSREHSSHTDFILKKIPSLLFSVTCLLSAISNLFRQIIFYMGSSFWVFFFLSPFWKKIQEKKEK